MTTKKPAPKPTPDERKPKKTLVPDPPNPISPLVDVAFVEPAACHCCGNVRVPPCPTCGN